MKKFLSKPSVRILVSVILMVLCFLMNRYFKIEQAPWSLLQYVLSIVLTGLSLYGIIKGISQMLTEGKQKASAPKFDPEHPVKIWGHEELFAYLEAEDIIDLDIDHEVVRRIGVASDFRRDKLTGKNGFCDKAYYINDTEYTDFNQFKEQFTVAHPETEVRILRASMDDGSMDVKLP